MRDVEDEYMEMLGEHIAQRQRRRVVAPREDDHGLAVTGLEVANLRSVQPHEAFREYRGRTVRCIECATHFAVRKPLSTNRLRPAASAFHPMRRLRYDGCGAIHRYQTAVSISASDLC